MQTLEKRREMPLDFEHYLVLERIFDEADDEGWVTDTE
jgi:hypothetical protein